jgi:LPXTG-motif cell wall-anchored protein
VKRPILCLAAAAVVLAAPAAAHADFPHFPDHPVQLFLKDHPEMVLTWAEEGLILDEGDAHWEFLVETEFEDADFEELVATGRLVHPETETCLTVDEAALPPVDPELADCDDATVWRVVADMRPSHEDLRFETDRGFRLGTSGHAAELGEAVRLFRPSGKHDEEWKFRIPQTFEVFDGPGGTGTPSVPEEQAPPGTPEDGTPQEASEAQPRLAATGASSATALAAGALALVAGSAALLWARRRSLPGRG